MSDDMTVDAAVRIVRVLISNGVSREAALTNPVIPLSLRPLVNDALVREETIVLRPVRVITADAGKGEWLRNRDRSRWYYWPTLRDYLLNTKNWSAPAGRSLDEATDTILSEIADPETEQFDVRGLVLGYASWWRAWISAPMEPNSPPMRWSMVWM